MTTRQLARALRRANARAQTKQAKFERAARLAIRDLIRMAATRFEKHVTSFTAAGTPPDWTPPSIDELLSLDEVIGHYRTKTDPVRLAAVNDFFDAFGSAALQQDLKANFHVSNPLVAAELEKTGSQITEVSETTRRNVRGIVSRAYQEGLSIDDTAAAIREYATSISAARAALIARTEFVGLVQGGQLAATKIVAEATGEPYLKIWRTAPGAEYPRHELYEGLDGQTVEIDATFIVGADLLKYPGDPDGEPGEVCNCRCSLEFVTKAERQAQIDAEQVAVQQEPLFRPSSEAQAIIEPTSTIPSTGQLDLSTGDRLGDGMNVNEVFLVERAGEQFVVKPVSNFPRQMRSEIPPGQDIERETSAYSMARWIERLNPELGVNTPELVSGTVTAPSREVYDSLTGEITDMTGGPTRAAISRFIPDAETGYESDKMLTTVSEVEIKNGGLYDAIIGNLDRHANNYMVDTWETLHLIDNGLTFPIENISGEPGNAALYRARVDRFGHKLYPTETKLLEDLVIHREEIDAELRANKLDEQAIEAMWERIRWMLETQQVRFGPPPGYEDAQLRRALETPLPGPTTIDEGRAGLPPDDVSLGEQRAALDEQRLEDARAAGVPTANVRYLLQDIDAQGLTADDLLRGNKTRDDLIMAGYAPEEIDMARAILRERELGGG
jgi:hypothetical protein